jgi:hypothetical protein
VIQPCGCADPLDVASGVSTDLTAAAPEARTVPLSVQLIRSILSEETAVRFTVTGGSMWPLIRGGDVVTLRRHSVSDVRLGDVVAFEQPERRLRVHRVVGRVGARLLTAGDAALARDEPVADSDLLGIVERVSRADHRVSLGLGPERVLIAFATRHHLLARLRVRLKGR